MRIGFNCDIFTDAYETAANAGFDYIEAIFVKFDGKTDAEIDAVKARIEKAGVPVFSANCLFFGDIQLLGEDATPWDKVEAYLEHGFSCAEKLGIKKVVCGSGKGRSIPEGYDKEKGTQELVSIFRKTADIAAKHGCMIIIEPLNFKESNVVNTVKEGLALVEMINHPSVQLLADSYHMRAVKESFDTLKNYKDVLAHTHIAEAIEGETSLRAYPNRKDENNIRSFVDALREMGYDDTLTVEASTPESGYAEAVKEAYVAIKSWL